MNSWIDFKYACRLLANKPAFAIVTVMIMALGLGLCIYNYSFIYGTALKDLPFEHGDRMIVVDLESDGDTRSAHSSPFSVQEYLALSKQVKSYDIFGFYVPSTVNLSGGERAVRYDGLYVKADFFDYTSTYPIKGRVFTQDDLLANAKPVAIISSGLWQGYFGGDDNILGRNMFVNGEEREIVGIMPENFEFPASHDVWMPSDIEPKTSALDASISVSVFGLLKQGVSLDEARLEIVNIYRRLEKQDPDTYLNKTPLPISLPMSIMGSGTVPLLVAMSLAVFFVLVLACVNVANLLYSRASERSKETAIRVALGAPMARLVMQMMWESLIICVFGGVVGILIAQVGLDITSTIVPSFSDDRIPFFWTFEIDTHILNTSIFFIIVTTLITGLLPAWKIISGDFNQVLRDGTRGAQGRGAGRVNRILVVIEVALSCALLTVSAMISIESNRARHVDYGVETDNMLTARIGLPEKIYETQEEQTRFFKMLAEDLRSQANVDQVVIANPLPGRGAFYRPIETEGFEKTKDNKYPFANSAEMFPGSMKDLNIELLAGRYFDYGDDANAQKVAVVTESFIERSFPNAKSVLGKKIRFVARDGEDEFEWMTIVGVVQHVIHGQPFPPSSTRPTIYAPMAQNQWRFVSVALKGAEDPYQMVASLNASLKRLDHNVPAFHIKTYDEVLRINTSGLNFISNIFNVFGFVALVLAAAGIYGVVVNSVQRRTHELGVRRALGATDQNIVGMLMRQGWIQLIIGVSIGLPIAHFMSLAVMRDLAETKSFLVYAMYVVMPLLIALIVTIATLVPARRAVKLEPTTALRYE